MRPHFAPLLLLLPGCAGMSSSFVDRGPMPARVHVAEDFETEIEKRWWLAGAVEVEGGNRVCRGTDSKDFDDKMGIPGSRWTAVVFNPVPGPPMGPNTRLSFRYKLKGTDTLRVQLFSLSNNYHRRLLLPGLPQGEWRDACVDMTMMRRPDGSGGPLSANERIDDIQFYVDPKAELWIDDILLYEAWSLPLHPGSSATPKTPIYVWPFPRRVIFTGWFDTGAQGKEWPGDFEIVPHTGEQWKCARSKNGVLRIDLRGERPVKSGRIRFRASCPAAGVTVKVGSSTHTFAIPSLGEAWQTYDFPFECSGTVNHVLFTGDVRVDDLLIYEP